MLTNTAPTPIEQITIRGVPVWVKRDDLNHPEVQGNKLRKLKYNFEYAITRQHSHLVTFGGAYSNHIAATAAAGHTYGVRTVGIIRGQEFVDNEGTWSNTLKRARQQDMHLVFINRSAYREKEKAADFKQAVRSLPDPFVVPEGGSNALGVQGAAELITELQQQMSILPTHIICACGTGGTLAGLIQGIAEQQLPIKVWGMVVHKAAAAISQEIQKLCPQHTPVNWRLFDQYHFGGYAKTQPQLSDFATVFRKDFGIALDQVYNCKSFFGLCDLISSGSLTAHDRPLIVHTGGLQGGVF